MYNFIYFVIYRQQLKKGRSHAFSKYNASLITALAMGVHLMVLVAVLRSIFFDWFQIHVGAISKDAFTFPVIAFFIAVYLYYNSKRVAKILSRYSARFDCIKTGDYIKVLAVIFIPIVVIFFLSKTN